MIWSDRETKPAAATIRCISWNSSSRPPALTGASRKSQGSIIELYALSFHAMR